MFGELTVCLNSIKKQMILHQTVRSMFGGLIVFPLKNGLQACLTPPCLHRGTKADQVIGWGIRQQRELAVRSHRCVRNISLQAKSWSAYLPPNIQRNRRLTQQLDTDIVQHLHTDDYIFDNLEYNTCTPAHRWLHLWQPIVQHLYTCTQMITSLTTYSTTPVHLHTDDYIFDNL